MSKLLFKLMYIITYGETPDYHTKYLYAHSEKQAKHLLKLHLTHYERAHLRDVHAIEQQTSQSIPQHPNQLSFFK